ncbi:pinin [Mycolicibacterium brisbanense]|uniref:Pinin n=1 Tax=Mycolicibacterium brisbanense TaxID=146020 RepID=A0A100VWQ2_9MYCO|nr:pinin [Mycolicibacterium brisbanense]
MVDAGAVCHDDEQAATVAPAATAINPIERLRLLITIGLLSWASPSTTGNAMDPQVQKPSAAVPSAALGPIDHIVAGLYSLPPQCRARGRGARSCAG